MFVRLLTLLTATLLCLAPLTAQTTRQIRTLQRQQTTLKKHIADQEQLLRTTRKDVNAQLSDLQILSAQIEGQEKYVSGIHSEVSALSGTIAGLEKQLQALEADLEDCRHKYRRAVTYMFRNRMQLSKWQFILSAHNFRQMYRRMRYLTDFSKYQRAQGRIIEEKEALVARKRDELLGVKTEKDRLLVEGRAQQQKLQSNQQERQQVVDALNKKQKQLQSSIAQQRRKAAQLDQRIDKLIQAEIAAAERRRKAEAERKRKEELARQARLKAQREREAARKAAARHDKRSSKSVKKSTTTSRKAERDEVDDTPSFTAADNADRALSGSFAANRGRLPMPITGPYAITTRYGSYDVKGLSGVRLDSKGINITGRPGAQARAVFRGEVTAIFTYGGMYNIIVRHGSYMSVYCNLSSTSVRRGQEVSARQSLGAVATDASGNCTLHFQLRKETSRLNPESWLGR